jgi:hypothetical protein
VVVAAADDDAPSRAGNGARVTRRSPDRGPWPPPRQARLADFEVCDWSSSWLPPATAHEAGCARHTPISRSGTSTVPRPVDVVRRQSVPTGSTWLARRVRSRSRHPFSSNRSAAGSTRGGRIERATSRALGMARAASQCAGRSCGGATPWIIGVDLPAGDGAGSRQRGGGALCR